MDVVIVLVREVGRVLEQDRIDTFVCQQACRRCEAADHVRGDINEAVAKIGTGVIRPFDNQYISLVWHVCLVAHT